MRQFLALRNIGCLAGFFVAFSFFLALLNIAFAIDKTSKFLIETPASLMDVGIVRLNQTMSGIAAGAGWPSSAYNRIEYYNPIDDQIVFDVTTALFEKNQVFTDCKKVIELIQAFGDINPETGRPFRKRSSEYALLFNPRHIALSKEFREQVDKKFFIKCSSLDGAVTMQGHLLSSKFIKSFQ